MDAPNSSPHQEKEGDQQPSELPIRDEKDKSQENSDHVQMQEAETRRTLATEPFEPILKVLADLESDYSKFDFPAARLVGLHRRLWESCVSKHIDGQKLEQENMVLKETDTKLRQKRDGPQARHSKQLARLRFFEQALNLSRQRLVGVLDDWNYPSRLNIAGLSDNATEK